MRLPVSPRSPSPRIRGSRIRTLVTTALLALGPTLFAAEGKIVTLPPFLVEEAAKPVPWRYADVAGLEVLSSCSERLTRELIANHFRLNVLLAELVPPSLQLRMSEKRTLLFVDSAHVPTASQDVVARMLLTTVDPTSLDAKAEPIDDGRLRRRPPPPRYTFLPNLRLWDRDSQALFAIVRESEFDPRRVALTSDYVAYVLQNRMPALPPWFISGVLSLFARATFSEDALTLEPIDWISASGSAALLGGTAANHPLLPLAEFFSGQLASNDPALGDAGLSLWQAQAALFVHWGVGGRGAPRRAAFRAFVERAAVESVTEDLFRQCFGLSFSAAQDQLTAYLPVALRERLALRPAQRPRLPDYALASASDVDGARLKGDWERLEVGFVRSQFPALAPHYLEQARRTLRRPYDAGSRDPRLLAVLGLCEVDAGNDTAARDFLEGAVAQGATLRPRAGFELARLRFAAAKGAGADRPPLTDGQAGEVLAPLLAARNLEPPLPEVYELIAEVWSASAAAPDREALRVLEEGVRLFPRRTELIYRAAALSLRHGLPDTARWQIALGRAVAPDAAARARFDALQAQLDARR